MDQFRIEAHHAGALERRNLQQFDTTRPTQFSTNRNPSNSQGSSSTVKDNPFASDTVSDSQIEADLQELGGQMAGSILDF